jgi:23S rRNA pseudouridine1911/1915/1917 synthase
VSGPREPLVVLYEDNHLLIVDKPAGVAVQGALPGEPSVAQAAREYIAAKYAKPGAVFLGVVSRLDAPVTGALVFARTSKAAARLSASFRDRKVEKTYWAWVEGDPPESGEARDLLVRDERRRRTLVVREARPDAQPAVLRWRRLERTAAGALLEIELETGRKHQIRAQLAARGWRIWGDFKYGSRRPFPAGIALHARRLVVPHPVREEAVAVTAPVPAWWPGG